MISFSSYATPSNYDVAEQLCEEPEDFAYVLSLAAGLIEDEQREELAHHLQSELTKEDRKRVRDLALMIAGACGEAE